MNNRPAGFAINDTGNRVWIVFRNGQAVIETDTLHSRIIIAHGATNVGLYHLPMQLSQESLKTLAIAMVQALNIAQRGDIEPPRNEPTVSRSVVV